MRIISSRRASTSLMFAVFAAVLTIGVMTMSRQIHNTMVAAINKSMVIHY